MATRMKRWYRRQSPGRQWVLGAGAILAGLVAIGVFYTVVAPVLATWWNLEPAAP